MSLELPDVGPPEEPGIQCFFQFGVFGGDLVFMIHGLRVELAEDEEWEITQTPGGAAMGMNGAHLQALVDEIRKVAEGRGITII